MCMRRLYASCTGAGWPDGTESSLRFGSRYTPMQHHALQAQMTILMHRNHHARQKCAGVLITTGVPETDRIWVLVHSALVSFAAA